jgi:hypothetical protein
MGSRHRDGGWDIGERGDWRGLEGICSEAARRGFWEGRKIESVEGRGVRALWVMGRWSIDG